MERHENIGHPIQREAGLCQSRFQQLNVANRVIAPVPCGLINVDREHIRQLEKLTASIYSASFRRSDSKAVLILARLASSFFCRGRLRQGLISN